MGFWDTFWDAFVDFLYRLFGYRKVVAASVLKDADGNPVGGRVVSLAYERTGQTVWNPDGSSTTGPEGNVVNSVHLRSGTYNFKADFQGDASFDPSSAEEDSVPV